MKRITHFLNLASSMILPALHFLLNVTRPWVVEKAIIRLYFLLALYAHCLILGGIYTGPYLFTSNYLYSMQSRFRFLKQFRLYIPGIFHLSNSLAKREFSLPRKGVFGRARSEKSFVRGSW
jgi:hypothetical protein